jgi:hypothetical protein
MALLPRGSSVSDELAIGSRPHLQTSCHPAQRGNLLSVATQPNSDEKPGVDPTRHEGGESACWAHLLCTECGAVLDGGAHAEDCSFNAAA